METKYFSQVKVVIQSENIEIPQTSESSMLSDQTLFDIMMMLILSFLISLLIYTTCFKDKRKQQPQEEKYCDERSFITKMRKTDRKIVIFFGTQTGTAEEFAMRLAREASRYSLKAMVADPEEYDMEDIARIPEIPQALAVFCFATYGEGDPTDNALEFIRLLKVKDMDLTGLNYAVFGLGNRTYEHFNSIGIYIDQRLEELGGNRIFEIGLGNDEYNIEDDFILWKERFWDTVCDYYHVDTFGEEFSLRQYRLVLVEDATFIYTGEINKPNAYKIQAAPFDAKNPFLSSVIVNRELYKGDRSCRHIELDITEAKLRYDAGDHVAIYPRNDSTLVEKIGHLFDVDLDTVFTFVSLDDSCSKKHPFPCPTTYRAALLHYVDITSIPRTYVLRELAEYASKEEEKQKLKLMTSSSDEGKALYQSWIVKDRRSIVHILEDLPSLKPPLDHLLELLPHLQARYYSISSSPKFFPTSVHITAVVVEYETPTKRINRGVTTGWLQTLQVTDEDKPKVPIYIRRTSFRLPKSQEHVIMIGPGTGLAPFRGFIQERAYQKENGKPLGEAVLYFGCRKQCEDFLYEEELKHYVEEGVLTKLYVAFSRDQPEKVYVTHLLKQNKEEVWKLIEQDAYIYVCGDARNMAKDVRDIILDIIKELGGKTQSEAETFMKKMEAGRRYSVDVWS